MKFNKIINVTLTDIDIRKIIAEHLSNKFNCDISFVDVRLNANLAPGSYNVGKNRITADIEHIEVSDCEED